MIVNLPEVFELSKLNMFSFGNADAKRDEIVSNSAYVTSISALSMMRTGNYNLIVGERGTGKSAIFKLSMEGKLDFLTQSDLKNHLIFIESDFELSSFKDTILKKIKRGNEKNKIFYINISYPGSFILPIDCFKA